MKTIDNVTGASMRSGSGGRQPRWAVIAVALLGAVTWGCTSAKTESDPAHAQAASATVVHIVDGDTFDVRFEDGTVERIRTPQVDTPEQDECGYHEATELLEDLILDQTVQVIPTASGPNADPHGRLLRSVEIEDGDVGAILISSGTARWHSRYAHEDQQLADDYRAAEQEARAENRGFWASCGWR